MWLETPTNPTMQVLDIEELSAIAHRTPNVIVVVDNTFLSPYFQRPLELGADISLHSVSKYLNGHSDVVRAAVAASQPARLPSSELTHAALSRSWASLR